MIREMGDELQAKFAAENCHRRSLLGFVELAVVRRSLDF